MAATARARRPSTPASVLRGTVYRIHRKPERAEERGLPKTAVAEVVVTLAGLEGDFNRYRHEEKHDDPDMAVLLEPLETLAELRREGWPIAPGDIGENFTTQGIAYHELFPGRAVEVGRARIVISKACTPCENLYLLPYVGRDRGPEFLRTMLDRRGWYARVDRPGRVRVGDPIRVLPA